MRIVARQIWWLQVIRMTIGCAVIAMGVLTPWLAAESIIRHNNWRLLRVMLPGGIAFAIVGAVFTIYARLEWRPRGFAVGMNRHGLILKVNGFRCPKLVVIKWSQIRGARYEPARFSAWPGTVAILLTAKLSQGTLPVERRGGVISLGPETVGLNGIWESWHPADVAALIDQAAKDPQVRSSF